MWAERDGGVRAYGASCWMGLGSLSLNKHRGNRNESDERDVLWSIWHVALAC
jgi:hypothetical protein